MKKTLALALALGMMLTLCAPALAVNDAIPFQGSFPISPEPIEMDAFTTDLYYKRCDFQDLEIWKYLTELTNVSFKFEAYPESDISEKFSLMLTRPDDQLPDVIYRVGISNAEVMQLAADGIIVPITDLLEEYAPHYWYQIQHNPALKAYVTMNDGEIYGMAQLYYATNYVTPPLFVHQEWLKALGYDEVPADTEEFKQMLIKFRDSDLNGNGEKDEVGIIATGFAGLLRFFAGAFGINQRGRGSQYLDDDDQGNLRFIPTSEGYRKMITYVKDLYQEGLIYPEIFSSSIKNMTAVGEQNRVLIGKGSLHYLGANNRENYVAMNTILKGPDGYQFNADIGYEIGTQNTFFTNNCSNIKEALQYFDYFYSTEGVNLYFMGFEGVTYEFDENGLPWYNDYVQHNPDGLINEEVLGLYVPWGGADNPSVYNDATFGNNMYTPMESSVCAERIKYRLDKEAWGSFNYSDEEYDRLAILEGDINTYVSDMRAKFVTGDADIDKDWDTYVETLNRMGLEELMSIYAKGLERSQQAIAE